MILFGKILVIASISLMFLAYSNFVPTALRSAHIAPYVRNHFVREVIFGLALAVTTIVLTLGPMSQGRLILIALAGSVTILPFWVAAAFGWATGGMEDVWGEAISARAAYMLHGTQVVLFYIGVGVLFLGLPS